MVLRLADLPAEFVDDMRRWREVGVPHAQVDDIGPPASRLGFQIVEDREEVEREPLEPVGLVEDPSLGKLFLQESPLLQMLLDPQDGLVRHTRASHINFPPENL